MSPINKTIGIFLLLLNIACAIGNFTTFAATGHAFNFGIGLMNAGVAIVLVFNMIRYWDGY